MFCEIAAKSERTPSASREVIYKFIASATTGEGLRIRATLGESTIYRISGSPVRNLRTLGI